jgi:hypothetical protein
MASTVLRKDYSGAGNKQRQTISVWVKKFGLGINQAIFSVRHTGNSNFYGWLRFKTDDSLHFFSVGGSVEMRTNRLFKDTNAWYHICVTIDTTQSTEADRLKIYINGVRETSFQTASYPSQNAEVTFGDDYRHEIGAYDPATIGTAYFDGVMSHFHFITNTAYQASTFGSTDATTGEWTINPSPTVTYATNSFFILKDGNSVTDQSGQGNNYTVAAGALTKTEDNPSSVFATLNSLSKGIDQTLSNGNTTMVSGTATSRTPSQTTLGMSSGKYYAEFKLTTSDNGICGVMNTQDNSSVSRGTEYYTGYSPAGWGYLGGGSVYNDASSVGGTWASLAVGDIVGVAINLDNTQGGLNKLYFSKNGVWQNGADPSNFTSVTGVVGITAPSNTSDGFYYFSVSDGSAGSSAGFNCNFGNGYFGTTAVSSAGSNASNNGIFEYDVPTGYTALSTKGLNL